MTGAGEDSPASGGTLETAGCVSQLAKVPVDKTKMTSYKEYIIELPNQGTALLHHLNEQRLNGKFCDITVMIHGRKFPAHRAVLSASSGYFHAMLDIDNDRHTIIVQDISAGAFQDLLDFMYSAKLCVSACSIVEIILTASYLQMVDVVSACSYIIRPVFGSNLPIGHFPHAGFANGTVEAAAHGCDCSKSGSPSLPTPHHPEIRIQPHVLAKAPEAFQEKVDSLEVLEKLRLEQKYHGAAKDQGSDDDKKSPLPVDIHEVYNQGGKKNKITMIHIPGMEQGGMHSFHGMPHLVPPGLRIREADSHFPAHDILQGRPDGPEGILDLRIRPKRSGEMPDGRSSPEEVRVWSAPSSFNTEKGPILKMTLDRNSQDWKNMGMAEKIAAQYHTSVPTPPMSDKEKDRGDESEEMIKSDLPERKEVPGTSERNKAKIVRQKSLDVPEKDNTDSEKAQEVVPPKGKWGWKAKRQESEESSVHPKKRICLDWDARSRHSSTSDTLSRQSSFDLDDGATSVKSEKDAYGRDKNCMAEKYEVPVPKKREEALPQVDKEAVIPDPPRSPNEDMKIKQEQKVVEKAQPKVSIPNGVDLNKMEDLRQHSPPGGYVPPHMNGCPPHMNGAPMYNPNGIPPGYQEYAERQNSMAAAFPNLPPTGMMPFSAFLASRAAGVLTPHPNGAAAIEDVPYNYPPDMMRGAVEKEAPPGWRGPGFVPWAGKRGRGRGRRGRGMQCRTYAEKMMHLRANAELDEVYGVTEGFPSLLGNKEHSKALGSPARFMNGNLSDSDSSKDGSEGKVPKNRASPSGSSDGVTSLSSELTRKRRKYTTEFKWEVNQKLTADGIDIASLSAETILSSGEDRPRQRPWKRVQLPCPICGARFPKVEQLQEHLVEHKGDKYSLYLSNWM